MPTFHVRSIYKIIIIAKKGYLLFYGQYLHDLYLEDAVVTTDSQYVYILLLANGNLYTGYTNNVEKRIAVHLSGKGSKCVRASAPVRIERVWKVDGSKGDALRIEAFIKGLTRIEKDQILLNPRLLARKIAEKKSNIVKIKIVARYTGLDIKQSLV